PDRDLYGFPRAGPARHRPLPSLYDLRGRTDQPDPPDFADGATGPHLSRVSGDLQRQWSHGPYQRQIAVPQRQPGALSPVLSRPLARGFLRTQALAAKPSRSD